MSMKGGEEPVGFILIKGTATKLYLTNSEQDEDSHFLKSTFYIVKRLI